VLFQAGSIDDPQGKEGLTALAADLLSQGGTQELTSAQLLEAFFPMASGIGAATDKELTVFAGSVHKDHAERFVQLFVASLTRPRWDPKEFERLREDAIQSIEKGLRTSDDESLGKAALDLTMWAGHPYGRYAGGSVQALKAMTLEDVKAHAAKVFTQDRMLIGIGGAVDERTTAALQDGLKALPATSPELVALPAPKAAAPQALVVEKEAASTAISLGYPWALRRGDPDFFPMMVAMSALGEHRQFNGRLMRELRVKRGLNYGDYAYLEHFAQEGWSTFARLNIGRRQQNFTVWLRPVVVENQLFAVRAALFNLERFRTQGLTQEELDATRGFLEGYSLLWQQTPMRRLGYAMDDLYYGTPNRLEAFRAALPGLTLAQVNTAVRKWIHPGGLSMAFVTKDGKALRQAILENTPSPITYAAETPDPAVLAEDQQFLKLPLGFTPEQVTVRPAAELFEK